MISPAGRPRRLKPKKQGDLTGVPPPRRPGPGTCTRPSMPPTIGHAGEGAEIVSPLTHPPSRIASCMHPKGPPRDDITNARYIEAEARSAHRRSKHDIRGLRRRRACRGAGARRAGRCATPRAEHDRKKAPVPRPEEAGGVGKGRTHRIRIMDDHGDAPARRGAEPPDLRSATLLLSLTRATLHPGYHPGSVVLDIHRPRYASIGRILRRDASRGGPPAPP